MTKYVRTAGGNSNAAATYSDVSSAGAASAAVPTAADEIVLDAGSGNFTVNAALVCRSINATGYTGTFTHNAAVTITIGDATAGTGSIALKFVAGMTYTLGNAATSAIAFSSTSTTQQDIDGAGKTFGNVTIDGVASSYRFTGILNVGVATVRLTNGTLNTNGQNCTWGFFALGTGTKTLTLGASTITITNTGTSWDGSTNSAGWTLNANTSQITLSGSGATTTFQGGGKTYNNVSFTGGVSFCIIGGTNTFANLTRTNVADNRAGLQFQADQTVTTLFTITGNSTINRIIVNSSANGTSRTITAAAVSLTNVDFRDIIGAGAATWSGTSLGNGGGNSGITFTAAVTRYWVGNGGNYADTTHWSASSGGASGATIPLIHDTAIFDANSITSAAQTITVNQVRVPTLDFTNVLNNPTLTNTTSGGVGQEVYGGIIIKAGMTLTGSNQLAIIAYSVAASITSNGVAFTQPMVPAAIGTGSVTFTDTFNGSNIMTFNSGTITANGNLTCTTLTVTAGTATFGGNINCTTFVSNNSNIRTVNMGSGTWTLSGTGTVFNTSTVSNMTLVSNAATIVVTDTSATQKTIDGRNLNGANVTVTGGGTGAVLFGSMTLNNLSIGAPKTVSLGNSMVINGLLTMVGSAGNIITLNSSAAGTQRTLTKTSGVVDADYVAIQDIVATGGAQFYASHYTNNGNNSGWIFIDSNVSLSDSGSTSATVDLTNVFPIADAGAGGGTIDVQNSFPLADTGQGTEAESTFVSVPLADAAAGTAFLSFDGNQNYADIGSLGNFLQNTIANGAYISFTFKTTNVSGGGILGILNSNGSWFNIRTSGGGSNGQISLETRDAAGHQVRGHTTNTLYTDGVAHTVEIFLTGTTIAINFDGVAKTVTYDNQTTQTTYGTPNKTFVVGAAEVSVAGVPDNFYPFSISQLTIGYTSSNLVAQYVFNQASGSTFPDLVGNNTGTLQGSPPPAWIFTPLQRDFVTLQNTFGLNDAGVGGVGTISIQNSFPLTDSGVGVETVSKFITFLPVALADAGLGVDSLNVFKVPFIINSNKPTLFSNERKKTVLR